MAAIKLKLHKFCQDLGEAAFQKEHLGQTWWAQIAPTKLISYALRSWPPLAVSCAQLLLSVASADPAGLVFASPIGFAGLRWDGCL